MSATTPTGESRLLIDGALVDAAEGGRFDNVNPATEEVLGQTADATAVDMDRAIAAARRAFDDTSWSTDRAFRQRCLRQLHEAIVGEQEQLRAELVADSRVIALYAEIVREVNGSLANFESLKRFRVVPHEWSIETGELTPSMKLKRRVITSRYAALINALYADEATSRGE